MNQALQVFTFIIITAAISELCIKTSANNELVLERTAFVIIYHSEISSDTKTLTDLKQSLWDFGIKNPHVYPGDQSLLPLGSWTYFPVFPDLWNLFGTTCDWFVFLNELSCVNLTLLELTLSKFDASQDFFIGYGLEDKVSNVLLSRVSKA